MRAFNHVGLFPQELERNAQKSMAMVTNFSPEQSSVIEHKKI